MQWVRAIYYLVGFDRAFPGKANLAAAIQAWELRHRKGDSPKPQADWDKQYARRRAGDHSANPQRKE